MWKIILSGLLRFLLFSFIIDICIVVIVARGWKMKVCLNGSTYETTEEDCRSGVWFTEPSLIYKACFEGGMWAVYKDWCEPNPIIWTVHPGKTGCMPTLENKVLGIVHLGNSVTGAAISTSNRRLFFNNKKLKLGPIWDFIDSVPELITWGKTPYSFQEKLGLRENQKCLIKGKHAFFAHYKIQLANRSRAVFHVGENVCTKKQTKGNRIQLLPNDIDFEILQSQSESMDFHCDIKDAVTCNIYDEEMKVTKEEVEKFIDEQSERIALRLYALEFHQDKVPDMEFEEWKYLELAQDIFAKVCPEKLVPKFFYKHIFSLFQFLILESFNLFPPTQDVDATSRIRIKNALNQCYNNAKPFLFSYDEDCSKGAPLLKTNNSDGKPVRKLIQVPEVIRINVEKFDLIVESAWKLMVFTHYYCADHFKLNPADLSLLQDRWQSLMAPDLIRRWKNPGMSYDMMKKLFMSINLQNAIQNLDYCLGAAHLDSTYQGWIKRPLTKYDFRRNRYKENLIWEGHAYCIDDYMYPATKLNYPIEKCGIKLLKN